MVEVEILVAIIGASAVVIGPIIGVLIKKYCEDKPIHTPTPTTTPTPTNIPCQILNTSGILRVAGYPIFNGDRCDETRVKCVGCDNWLCPFHYPVNSDNSLNGGHICVPTQQP